MLAHVGPKRGPKIAIALLTGLALPLWGGDALAQAGKRPARSRELTLEEVANGVQRVYQKARTFKAAFKQQYRVYAYQKRKDSDGTVVFAKPGKMAWRYSNGNWVVSNGKVLQVYEADNKQLHVQRVGKSQFPAALAFLTGGAKLRETLELRKLDPKRARFKGGHVLVGKPKQSTTAFETLLLYVDGKTFQVRRVLLLDAQGNRNRFDFTRVTLNPKVAPGELEIKPPPGTVVVGQ